MYPPDSHAHNPLPLWQHLGLIGLATMVTAMVLTADARWIPQPQYIFAGFGFGLIFIARDAARGHSLRPFGAILFSTIGLMALAVAATGRPGLALLLTATACTALLAAEAPPRPGSREQRRYVWSLVERTVADTLAPFALRTDKSYVFSADGRAAVAYRVRWGTAVASGDPVGDSAAFDDAIDAFCRHAANQGWRIAALGFSPRVAAAWRARGLWSLSIGRDVVIDITQFAMQGRAFRNLRQSVQHTRNCGVTTEIIKESEIGRELRQELESLMRQTPQGLTPRGFVMILDQPLRSEHPGCYIAIARDRHGRAVACQRYASADQGRELSLDLPWRLNDAPNGVDERLIIDTIDWARARDGQRLSLSFAPFPDLFAIRERKPAQQLAYWAAHRLDRFIQLESLYLFLRKFHAFGEHRYVALRLRDLLPAAGAILSLEFSAPRRDRSR